MLYMVVIYRSFFNCITCYVSYFALIFFNVYVLCSLLVYLMLRNKFVLLYSWLYWNISLLYKLLWNVLYNILCRCPEELYSHVVVIHNQLLLYHFLYNILWKIVCRCYQYMHIAII